MVLEICLELTLVHLLKYTKISTPVCRVTIATKLIYIFNFSSYSTGTFKNVIKFLLLKKKKPQKQKKDKSIKSFCYFSYLH